jgi:hypothetical protein
MTATRTDVHAPASADFDPQAYDCYGVFDFTPEFDFSQVAERRDLVNTMIERGYRFGGSTTGGCGHCGTNIRYGALMARDDVMEMIWVGETCLDNRFDGMTKAEFQKLRKTAALNREQMAKAERIAALCEEYPILAELTYAGNGGLFDADWSEFLSNMQYALVHKGFMSERQIAAAVKSLGKAVEFLDRKAARDTARAAEQASAAPVPSGRVVITGTVVKVDWKENGFGGREVMTVKHADGWLVWGSVPKSLNTNADGFLTVDSGVKAGDTVTFTATVEASDRPEFGFFTRPTKASKGK